MTAFGVPALLVGFLIALLVIPIDLRLRLVHDGGWARRGNLRWMFGVVSRSIGAEEKEEERSEGEAREEAEEADREDLEESEKKAKHAGRGRGAARGLAMLRTPGFLARLLRFVRHLLRAVRVRSLDLDARVGLDDPAHTGMLWGLLGPLSCTVPLPDRSRLRIEPDFVEARFTLDLDAEVRVLPAEVFYRAIQLALSPRTWRALYAAARA